MAQVQRAISPIQRVAVRSAGLVVLAMLAGPVAVSGYAQVSGRKGQAYAGKATVSVAMLQVPEQAWKHFEKARTFALKQRYTEAERECDTALAIAPSFAPAHVLEASQQVFLKNYAGAILHIAAAKRADPDAAWAGVVLAAAFNGMRRYDDAMTQIAALQGPEASSWQAKYEETRSAIGLGDAEAALKLSKALLEVAPKNFPDATLVRANALMLAHQWLEAATSLEGYLALGGQQGQREEVQNALIRIRRRQESEPTVGLASK